MMNNLRTAKPRLSLYGGDYVKWEYDGTEYAFRATYDDFVESPREVWDQIDTMACWHNRYRLGDDVGDVSPEEFWHKLVREYVSDERILEAALNGELAGIRLAPSEEEPAAYDIYETCYLAGWQTRKEAQEYLEYSEVEPEAVADYLLDDLTVAHCQILLEPYVEWLDLWLYDHSGITMSCSKHGNPFTCPWDSGQVGWIVARKDVVLEETSATEETWRDTAIREMEQSVDVYDKYIMGECFVYTVYEKGEDGEWFESDNIGGFYGADILENGAIEYAGSSLEDAIAANEYETGSGEIEASWL